MIFKNMSNTTRTFYGVVFEPDSVHEVPGPINAPLFVQVFELPKCIKSDAHSTDCVETIDADTEKISNRRKSKFSKEGEE